MICSRELSLPDFFRNFIRTTLTAKPVQPSQNADSPRNVAILRKSCRNASCVKSSASAVLPTILKHSEYTRRLCNRYNRSKAAASPCWASRIASGSGISPGSVRLARATLPAGTHPKCDAPPSQKLYFWVLPAQFRDRRSTRCTGTDRGHVGSSLLESKYDFGLNWARASSGTSCMDEVSPGRKRVLPQCRG